MSKDAGRQAYEDGMGFHSQQQYGKAVEAYSKAIELASGNPEYYYARYGALRFLGRDTEALADINHAISLDPRNPGLYIARAYGHLHLQHVTEVRADLATACKVSPQVFSVWQDRGRILAQLGDFSSAIPCFDRALSLAPATTSFLDTRTVINHRIGEILYDRGVAKYSLWAEQTKPGTKVGLLAGLKLRRLKREAQADLNGVAVMPVAQEKKDDAAAKLRAMESLQ